MDKLAKTAQPARVKTGTRVVYERLVGWRNDGEGAAGVSVNEPGYVYVYV